MLPDGSRRRTPGGVFFSLVHIKGTPEVQALWSYQVRAERKRQYAEKVKAKAVEGETKQEESAERASDGQETHAVAKQPSTNAN